MSLLHGRPPLAIKTLTYAVMHFVVAILVAYALTRDWRAALAIGIAEPVAQTIAFAIHERVWRAVGERRAQNARVKAEAAGLGVPMGAGPPLALRTLTYAGMHLVVAILVAYALTRDWKTALAIGLIEPMVQTVAFAIHEKVWERAARRGRAAPESAPQP
jgi:uncharacterized membrane protein